MSKPTLPPPPPNIDSEPPERGGGLRAQKMVQDIVTGVIIVLFIGFTAAFISVITLWVQSLHEKSASYEDLKNKIIEQSAKIDLLYGQSIKK